MTDVSGRIAGLFVYPIKGCHAVPLADAVVEPWGLQHDRRYAVASTDGRVLTQREHPALARVHCCFDAAARLHVQVDGVSHALPPAGGDVLAVRIWNDVVEAECLDGALADALGALMGRPVRLVRFPAGGHRACDPAYAPPGAATAFADGFPLLVTNEGTLVRLDEALVERGAEPVPMDRFRPNVVLTGMPSGAEDDHDRLVLDDGFVLDLAKPCTRCTVTTIDQDSGEAYGDQPLALLRQMRRHPVLRQPVFGQNAVPRLAPGGSATLRVGQTATLSGSVRA